MAGPAGSGAELFHDIVGRLEIRGHALHVIVILERIDRLGVLADQP